MKIQTRFGELGVYFNSILDALKSTNRDIFGDFYLDPIQFEQSVF